MSVLFYNVTIMIWYLMPFFKWYTNISDGFLKNRQKITLNIMNNISMVTFL